MASTSAAPASPAGCARVAAASSPTAAATPASTSMSPTSRPVLEVGGVERVEQRAARRLRGEGDETVRQEGVGRFLNRLEVERQAGGRPSLARRGEELLQGHAPAPLGRHVGAEVAPLRRQGWIEEEAAIARGDRFGRLAPPFGQGQLQMALADAYYGQTVSEKRSMCMGAPARLAARPNDGGNVEANERGFRVYGDDQVGPGRGAGAGVAIGRCSNRHWPANTPWTATSMMHVCPAASVASSSTKSPSLAPGASVGEPQAGVNSGGPSTRARPSGSRPSRPTLNRAWAVLVLTNVSRSRAPPAV